MQKPNIQQYLLANCQYVIDEFNIMYKDYEQQALKQIADEKFNEMDITVKIGSPFKQNVHYTVGEGSKTKKELKINHDIYVEQKDYKIEIKYLKNWKTPSNTRSATKTWDVFQQDFNWLMDEISVEKGKSAFIIGWFNCVKSFSQLIQLGKGNGAYPLVNESRICYFPFLKRKTEPTRTNQLEYKYECAYTELQINPITDREGIFNCMFLGNKDDTFHFAIYY